MDDETLHAELVYKAITIWQIGPSLRMGNTVVAKPSEYTPPVGSGIEDISPSDWNAVLAVNLTGAFLVLKHALPELRRREARRLHAGVVERDRGHVHDVRAAVRRSGTSAVTAAYASSREHALIGLTRTLARDYGRHGVRVNAVWPGWVQTPMADEEMHEFASHAGLT